MSLSTLLEAAKYLDYLDSNNHQQQQQQQQQQHQHQQHHLQQQSIQGSQSHQTSKKPARRQRASKKNAANAMVAMSLPTSSMPIQMHGVPIPMNSGVHHQAASLSSSFTTGSPLSSFASTALLCSKASGVDSATSSAASSLSSSDSSSSCGEILMGDNDFNASTSKSACQSSKSNNHHNYHLTHQQNDIGNQLSSSSSGNNQSIARYIAATSAGPQLVTMTTNPTSTSATNDSTTRAMHVIHAAKNGALMNVASGASFDSRHFSMTAAEGLHHQQVLGSHDGQPFSSNGASSFSSDIHLGSSPSSCPPLIMARVQPMILNSLSPSAQGIMAFQPATASSPTSSSSSYSRHRELHKTLEKNRRAHLRHCFELLKAELPASECVDKKTSHINIIKSAIRYVLALRQQECEIDNELQRLTKIKGDLTENLTTLRANQSSGQRPTTTTSSPDEQQLKQEQQQPVAEQQLSFLLSQSKID